MLEKNVSVFAKFLEEMNMKNSAETFKAEFLAKPNDEYQLGKYNILKHLQKELNKCTGSNISAEYSPTSARKKTKPSNAIYDQLIQKISKKQKIQENSKNQESTKTNSKINPKSKLFLHLSSQLEKDYEKSIKNKNKSNKIFDDEMRMKIDTSDDNNDLKEDLPIFGSQIKKNKKNDDEDSLFNKSNEKKENNNLLSSDEKEKNILNQSFGENNNNNIQVDVNYDEEENNKSNNESSIINTQLNEKDLKNNYDNTKNTTEEYQDDDDPGYDLYECDIEYFRDTCQKLSEDNDFPHRGVYKSKYKNYKQTKMEFPKPPKKSENNIIKLITYNPKNKEKYIINNNPKQDDIWKFSKLSKNLNFPSSKADEEHYYPVFYKKEFIDSYDLKVVVDRERTGFEESKDFKIVINNLIAGRYQIMAYLGNAAFSKAVKCLDIKENKLVCLKIVENNKNYFDQSLDEIKILNYINSNGNPDELHFLKVIDFFYYKEHLFIVSELLRDNLYDFYDYLTKNNIENYFTLPRIQLIAKQVLTSLNYIHSLHLIHCDLKPENILLKSITDSGVKIIDFGSTCFIHDYLSSYIQSRSYRAPEVIMGCTYDYKIDIWSLGCILAELYSKIVLFQSDSIHNLLAKVIGIIGPIPEWMYEKGTTVNGMFCQEKLLYMEVDGEADNSNSNINNISTSGKKKMHVIVPKRTLLKNRMHCNDEKFVEFIRFLLRIDPNERPTAAEALKHPWLSQKY